MTTEEYTATKIMYWGSKIAGWVIVIAILLLVAPYVSGFLFTVIVILLGLLGLSNYFEGRAKAELDG